MKCFFFQEHFSFHDALKGAKREEEHVYEFLLKMPAISKTCDRLIELLKKSIKERIINTPKYCKQCVKLQNPCTHARLGILFSGGIDCAIISLIADQFVDRDIPIDLLNVAFEKVSRVKTSRSAPSKSSELIDWNVPDRCTAKQTLTEMQHLTPTR